MEREEQIFSASSLPSSSALAYLGDAVHSLYARRAAVLSGRARSADLHELGQRYVTAAAQAVAFDRIYDLLTEEERDVANRARNSHHLQRPKHMSVSEYRKATGLEALLGMLDYTGQQERLTALMEVILKD